MTEIDLNDLTIKTDSLPDTYKLLLINPTTGLPAQNIPVSRFIELLTQKLPEATNFTKGLMSELDFIASMRNKGSFSDKTLNSITETGVYISHGGHPGPWGIMAVFKGYLYIFQLIANPHFFTIRCSTSNGAEWSSTTIGLNSDTIFLAENSLTEAISLNNKTLPPPPANCVPNHSESAGCIEQFADSALSDTDIQQGSIPVKSVSNEVQEQYIWSIDKIGKAVLELQQENKRLKQILNISDENEVQIK